MNMNWLTWVIVAVCLAVIAGFVYGMLTE